MNKTIARLYCKYNPFYLNFLLQHIDRLGKTKVFWVYNQIPLDALNANENFNNIVFLT